jgi:hypothetical protein
MVEKLKRTAQEIVWTAICAGYSYRTIAKFYEMSPMTIARIAYGGGYAVENAIKVLEKHRYKIEIIKGGE